MKVIKIDEDAILGLKKGADFCGNRVKKSLGPAGRNIVIGSKFTAPRITNDGKAIADAIELEDETENLGVQMIRNTTDEANKLIKGGRSTAMVLSQAIIGEGYKMMDNAGSLVGKKVNPMAVLKQIMEAKDEVIATLEKGVQKAETLEDLQKVAFVASESKEYGDMIADIVYKIGKDGVVNVEESDTLGVDSEITEGMEIKSGYVSQMMVTNDKMESVVEKAHILVTNGKIMSDEDIKPIAETLHNIKNVNDLVIFTQDFDQSIIPMLVLNRMKNVFRVLLVKVNAWDKGIYEDICTVTGATLIDTNKAMLIKNTTLDQLAIVDKVVSTADKTVIIGGTPTDRDSAITRLKNQIETATPFDKVKLEERIARISGKVATIRVGAMTEIERGRIKDKIDDAVSEAKLALEGGVVKGGGLALKEVADQLPFNILGDAIRAPYDAIQENAGGLVIGEDIIDAFLVTKKALEIACSNASNFLTVATSSADKYENDTEKD